MGADEIIWRLGLKSRLVEKNLLKNRFLVGTERKTKTIM